MVHGDEALGAVQSDAARAIRRRAMLGGRRCRRCADVPATMLPRDDRGGPGDTELVVIAGLAKSKSEALRLIEQGGVYDQRRAR